MSVNDRDDGDDMATSAGWRAAKNKAEAVEIDYTWRGERSKRRIRPLNIAFQSSKWHPEPQWVLHAIEGDKGVRGFAMKDIHSWEPELAMPVPVEGGENG